MMLIEELPPGRAQQIQLRWFLAGNSENRSMAYEVLPKSNVDLIFRSSASSCEILLLGPVTERTFVEFDPTSDYIGIRFRTDQVPRLADVSFSDLVGRRVALAKIVGKEADSLAERFNRIPDPHSRHRVMEELIQAVLPLIRDERCRRGVALLEACGGRLRVNELAAELGLSVRSLERLFHNQLGIPAKRVARLIRLRQLISTLRAGRFGSFADLAYAHGYSDQAHMIKDLKEMTGRVPGCCSVKSLAQSPFCAIHNRQALQRISAG